MNQFLRDPAIKTALQKIESCGLTQKIKPASIEVFAQNGMLLIELHSKAQILHFAQELGSAPDEALQALIDELQTVLANEREQNKILQSRLATAEQHHQAALTAHAAETRRYAKLKTTLAKEFHPDNFHGPASEKRHRTELFQRIWTHIESLEKS
jgi:hypothetical protein